MLLRMLRSRLNHSTVVAPAEGAPLFQEVQRFRSPWLWAVLLVVAASVLAPLTYLCVVQLGTGQAVGSSPMSNAGLLAVTAGNVLLVVAMFAFFYSAALYTEVDVEGVYIRFRCLFVKRRIRFDEIAEFFARTYSPLREYGGWGIRGFSSNRAYNVSGDRGVQLVLADGKRVLIGSQRADALVEAIAEASGRSPTAHV